MNSPIKLPVGTHVADANPSGPWFDADDMRAYAEQAVREALAALKIDERAAFEDWVLSRYPDSPSMRWCEDDGYVYVNEEWNAWKARASLISENPNVEGADIQHP